MRVVTVTENVEKKRYESVDGILFDSLDACAAYEREYKEGKSKCQHCNGAGYFTRHENVFVEPEFRDMDDGERDIMDKCPVCHGWGCV
jgi:DnaJ-class molecular chaperone